MTKPRRPTREEGKGPLGSYTRPLYVREDYSPPKKIYGVQVTTPPVHNTLDGAFSQLIQFACEKELQVNLSTLEPQSIKGFHYHREPQFDYFYPLDPLIIGLYDDREDSVSFQTSMKFMAHRQIIKIPPGVAHGLKNPGFERRSLLYFVTCLYGEGENELRAPWYILGKDFWETEPS